MFDVDSFKNILAIVRACVKANRADLIESALINRQHAGEVTARIESERATRPAAPSSSRSIFGEPTPEQRDVLAEAVRKRFEQYRTGHAG
jgi:hypothetical protein